MNIKKTLMLGLSVFFVLAGISLSQVQAATNHILTVDFASPDGGSVAFSTGGSCSSDCTKSIPDGTNLTLTASVNSGFRFIYWANGIANAATCNEDKSSKTCTFTMDQDFGIVSLWQYTSVNINVSKKGTGSGTVSGTGINCGGDCKGTYTADPYTVGSYDTTKLTAKAAAGSKFVGWDSDGDTCYIGGGKGGAAQLNPALVCDAFINPFVKDTKAIAIFNSTGSGSGSSSSSEDNSSSTSSTPSSTQEPSGTDENKLAAPSPNSPATKSLSELAINGEALDPAKAEKKEFAGDAPIVLSGKTIPNGIVTLYVFSEPKKYTTTADRNGNWQFAIKGLPAGDHHAEIEVTDPKTKETSKRSNLLAFAVMNASTSSSASANSQVANAVAGTKSLNIGIVIAGIIGAIVVLSAASLAALAQFKPDLFARIKSKFHKQPPVSPEV